MKRTMYILSYILWWIAPPRLNICGRLGPVNAVGTRPPRACPLGYKVGGRGSLAAGYSAHKKAQSRPGFGLLRASVLTSNREEKQLVL